MPRHIVLIVGGLTFVLAFSFAVEPAAAHFPRDCNYDDEVIANAEWARSLTMSKMWPYNVQGASLDWYAPSCPAPVYAPAEENCPLSSLPVGGAVVTPATEARARITVRVSPDAMISFNGALQATPSGAIREFMSPPLTAGLPYLYEVRADWRESGHAVTRTRQLTVTAGERLSVDLTAAAPDSSVESAQVSQARKGGIQHEEVP